MNIKVTDKAVHCLKHEWDFASGDYIRIYPRYASGGPEPYMLGILKESPHDHKDAIYIKTGDLVFYMKEDDLWMLDNRNLTIDAEGIELQFLMD